MARAAVPNGHPYPTMRDQPGPFFHDEVQIVGAGSHPFPLEIAADGRS